MKFNTLFIVSLVLILFSTFALPTSLVFATEPRSHSAHNSSVHKPSLIHRVKSLFTGKKQLNPDSGELKETMHFKGDVSAGTQKVNAAIESGDVSKMKKLKNQQYAKAAGKAAVGMPTGGLSSIIHLTAATIGVPGKTMRETMNQGTGKSNIKKANALNKAIQANKNAVQQEDREMGRSLLRGDSSDSLHSTNSN